MDYLGVSGGGAAILRKLSGVPREFFIGPNGRRVLAKAIRLERKAGREAARAFRSALAIVAASA